jgi:hypothetical protein
MKISLALEAVVVLDEDNCVTNSCRYWMQKIRMAATFRMTAIYFFMNGG